MFLGFDQFVEPFLGALLGLGQFGHGDFQPCEALFRALLGLGQFGHRSGQPGYDLFEFEEFFLRDLLCQLPSLPLNLFEQQKDDLP